MSRMGFGIFLPPYHCQIGEDPISAYERDIEVLQLIDRLGFDEAWIGEHHSAGAELIPDPALFIAHVANHTRHLKLGTGVVTLPYHNPLWLADRMLLLDNLTRGRAMLGMGSGAFPTDAEMIGLTPYDLRGALAEDLDVLMHLLTSSEPISVKTDRYELTNARCQLRPYSHPMFETALTSVISPSGPTLAGKYGAGMLSVSASSDAGFGVLDSHWDVYQRQCEEHGHVPERAKWRLVAPMHLAETKEQALEDVRFGLPAFQQYFDEVLAGSLFQTEGRTVEELVDWANESGFGVVGTPEMAVEMLERLEEKTGGFGTFLFLHHEWANPDATRRHYELFARFVKPRFQGTTDRLQASVDYCRSVSKEYRARHVDATQKAVQKHAEEKATDGS